MNDKGGEHSDRWRKILKTKESSKRKKKETGNKTSNNSLAEYPLDYLKRERQATSSLKTPTSLQWEIWYTMTYYIEFDTRLY